MSFSPTWRADGKSGAVGSKEVVGWWRRFGGGRGGGGRRGVQGLEGRKGVSEGRDCQGGACRIGIEKREMKWQCRRIPQLPR
jgi:hypothetical protein